MSWKVPANRSGPWSTPTGAPRTTMSKCLPSVLVNSSWILSASRLAAALIEGDLQVPTLDVAQGVHERPGNIEGTADDECQKIQRSIGQRHRPFRGIVFPVANTADALDEIQLATFDAIVAFIGFHPFSPEVCSAIGRLRRSSANGFFATSATAARAAVPWRSKTPLDLYTGVSGHGGTSRVWRRDGSLRSSPSSPTAHRGPTGIGIVAAIGEYAAWDVLGGCGFDGAVSWVTCTSIGPEREPRSRCRYFWRLRSVSGNCLMSPHNPS